MCSLSRFISLIPTYFYGVYGIECKGKTMWSICSVIRFSSLPSKGEV